MKFQFCPGAPTNDRLKSWLFWEEPDWGRGVADPERRALSRVAIAIVCLLKCCLCVGM